MNVVFIIPTGIGCEIGGHSGDATPAAKLIASTCDKLFIHPNVVNASDINEMTDNMLYVEGSILDRFLEGTINLKEVYSNKILLVVNKPVNNDTINAVSAARSTIGANIEILELNTPIEMYGYLDTFGMASGEIKGHNEALEQLKNYDFDVLVVNTPIKIEDSEVDNYLTSDGGVNVWGGVEAILSKTMSEKLNKPVIHAPIENSELFKKFNSVVDPRKSSEMVSICYLHCCLKGAHKAPLISDHHISYISYNVRDIDFLVTPFNVYGRPHAACVKHNIPIIGVKENKTIFNVNTDFIMVDNYLEAAGMILAKKAGVSIESIRRPLNRTKIL